MDKILNFIKQFLIKEKKFKKPHSMVKTFLTGSADLTLKGNLDITKELVHEGVKKIADPKNPYAVLDYAKKEGVKTYFIKNAENILKLVNEKQGLIFKKNGLKALFLNLLTQKKLSFETDIMFIFEFKAASAYTILYNFYKWYANKAGLSGFDEESLSKFKNLEIYNNKENLDKLELDDIIGLKQAIAREKEAMEFVLAFMKEIEAGKNAYNVMKNNGGASV